MAENYVYRMSLEFSIDPVVALHLDCARRQGLRDRAARKRLDRSCCLLYRIPARQKWMTRADSLLDHPLDVRRT